MMPQGPQFRIGILDRIRMVVSRTGQHLGRGFFGATPTAVKGTTAVLKVSKRSDSVTKQY